MDASSHWRVRSPGRVNLLGEHVDYNGGPVLPAAIDRYLWVEARSSDDGKVHLQARDLNASVTFSLEGLECRQDDTGEPLPDWALYPAGVAWALQQAGLHVAGINAAFHSEIPIGAGLSSSAALEAAYAVLWQAAGGWQIDRMALAQICLRAEREYVGLSCGILDQFAVLHGKAGQAMLLETANLAWCYVPVPDTVVIVISDSGQRRSLTDSSYNQRADECAEALSWLREAMPSLASLAALTAEQLSDAESMLTPQLFRRVRHVVEETERTRTGAALMEAGDLPAFGQLMLASHDSLRSLYEVSTPLLDELVALAMAQPGCYGSRLTGAGFGGCTVSLVERGLAGKFCQALSAAGFSTTACQPAAGAILLGES